jgi:hypothetical protein
MVLDRVSVFDKASKNWGVADVGPVARSASEMLEFVEVDPVRRVLL